MWHAPEAKNSWSGRFQVSTGSAFSDRVRRVTVRCHFALMSVTDADSIRTRVSRLPDYMMPTIDRDRYPTLLAPLDTPGATGAFVPGDQAPSEELIGNAYLVPRLGEQWLYMIEAGGRLQFPGGKKEPGEHHRETLRREVLEELGAEIVDAFVVGHWLTHSKRERPFRPHLPHPVSAAVVYCGEVRLVGSPGNPVGAKETESVVAATLRNAVQALRAGDRHDLADLYLLASDLAASRPGTSTT